MATTLKTSARMKTMIQVMTTLTWRMTLIYMEGVGEDVEDATMPVEQDVQVGYAEKKSRLWIHYKYACERKEIRWPKRATACRPFSRRDPLGAPWTCRLDDVAHL
jgi:hypothetical protein